MATTGTPTNSGSDLIFRRRISTKHFLGAAILLAIVAIGIWIGGYLLRSSVPAWLTGLLGGAPLLFGIPYIWLVLLSTEYRVFQDSLEVESGLISRSIDNIQLF